MIQEFSPDFDALELQVDEIYRNLGYGNTMPDAETIATVNNIVNHAHAICKPLAMFKICSSQLSGTHLVLDGVEMKTGKIIANYLTETSQVAVFVATAGIEYDNYLQNIKASGDIYTEFLADAVGSEIAEATVRFVSREVEKLATKKGMFITLSYSPGYCGWHVREQLQLFSLLPTKPCGITLNDSCLMHPVKSVSGIIGLSQRPDIKVPYSCDICGLQTCYKRKTQ